MGYAIVFGNCINCGMPFGFNPHKVPSVRVNGERCPVCETCIKTANEIRRERGIPEFQVPEDAYQPINEELL